MNETLDGSEKLCGGGRRARDKSLMYTVAVVNTERQRESDGWRGEWQAFVLDFLSSRMQHINIDLPMYFNWPLLFI